MKKFFKSAHLVVALSLAAGVALTGCGNSAPSRAVTSSQTATSGDPVQAEMAKGPVKLIGYQMNDDLVDKQMVLDALNKKLSKDINTTVDLRSIGSVDADDKYKLLFASGEDFDFIYSGSWMGFQQVATTNGYAPIDLNMVKTFAPDTYANTSKDRWQQVTVNGKIYGLPNNNPKIKNELAVFRGDIAKQFNITDISSPESFVNALLKIAGGQKNMITWDVGNTEQNGRMRWMLYGGPNNYHDVISGIPVLDVSETDKSYKVFNILDDPKYLDYLKTTKELADAGVWSKSALASTDSDETNFKNLKSAVYITDSFDTFDNDNAMMVAKNPDYANKWFDVNPGSKKIPEGGNMSMVSIHAGSKHPERVMMMFNLFENNKSYFDLLNYGIAGTHYEPVGDNQYKLLPESKNFAGGFSIAWGSNNAKLIRHDVNVPQSETDYYNKTLQEDSIVTPLATFVFDDSKVKNEEAAVTNVINTYMSPIELGLTDQTAGLAQFKSKLKAAGIDKLQTELQNQLDAYVKAYNAQ